MAVGKYTCTALVLELPSLASVLSDSPYVAFVAFDVQLRPPDEPTVAPIRLVGQILLVAALTAQAGTIVLLTLIDTALSTVNTQYPVL